MEIEQLVDEFYSGRTTVFAGMIKIKDLDVQIQSELKIDQKQNLLMINNISINKTNVALTCVYVVDVRNDEKNKVLSDLETLVSYMFFGVDKVAKKELPQPAPQ